MTQATNAVKAAISAGQCGQAAVDFLRAQGQPAELVSAGAPWPANRHVIMWYGKGSGCDGKFQYVSAADGGGDSGYQGGWEIRWDPGSWVNGVPTKWQFNSFAPWSGVIITPPPVTPAPSPQPVPQPTPICDTTKIDALAAQLAQAKTEIIAVVNEPGWFKQVFGNKYVQMALSGIGAYFATKAAQ